MTTKELLNCKDAKELIFDVDYNTINSIKICINKIVNAYDFRYKYDANGNLLNFPINVSGSVWNSEEMYIYNSQP